MVSCKSTSAGGGTAGSPQGFLHGLHAGLLVSVGIGVLGVAAVAMRRPAPVVEAARMALDAA